ncbi:helix-turn-helix domain-containing protein [Streptomyces sp. NPDC057838]|uniref:helix-turn-helix domain-containing protein n=1 Tax=unclassified Streptomyces TaxID=2593676 RepID=UPI0036899C3A
MVAADLPIGDRIRHYRRGRRQDAVAGLVGISPDYLSQIERGLKVPSLQILYALAQELGVPTAALLSEAPPAEEETTDTAEAGVGRALLGYGSPRSTVPVPAAELRDRVEAAWRSWQTDAERFTKAAETLPQLVADVEHAARAARAGSDPVERRAVLRSAADLYCLLRSYLRRTGRVDLATLAADRATRAAEDADDPLRIAAAQWNLGHFCSLPAGPVKRRNWRCARPSRWPPPVSRRWTERRWPVRCSSSRWWAPLVGAGGGRHATGSGSTR